MGNQNMYVCTHLTTETAGKFKKKRKLKDEH